MFFSPMAMMGAGATLKAQFIAAGALPGSSGGTWTITPPANVTIKAGDICVWGNPYFAGGGPVDAKWLPAGVFTNMYNYDSRTFWRVLEGPADPITVPRLPYGVQWAIYRNVLSIADVIDVGQSPATVDYLDLPWPAKGQGVVGLVAFLFDRDSGPATPANPAYASRVQEAAGPHFTATIADRLVAPTGAHTDRFSGFLSTFGQVGHGIELRRLTGTPYNTSPLPAMTGANSPIGYQATASSLPQLAWWAFAGTPGSDWYAYPGNWLQLRLPTERKATSYTIKAGSAVNRGPRSFSLQGSLNGITWTTLDTRISEPDWAHSEARTYQITGGGAYYVYRLLLNPQPGSGEVIINLLSFAWDDGTSVPFPVDLTPDDWNLPDVDDAPVATLINLGSFTVEGIEAPAPISVQNGQYRINGGAWTDVPGSVEAGATTSWRGMSSDQFDTGIGVTQSVGTVSHTTIIRTEAADATPASFEFEPVEGAPRSTWVESNTITVEDINVPVAVTAEAGLQYSKNGGAFTSSPGTAVRGNTFKVRLMSSASFGTELSLGLTIGSVTSDFIVETEPPAAPLPAPFYDDFGAPTGGINGRTRNSEVWAIEALSGTNFASLSVVTAGGLNGSIGTLPLNTYGSYKPAVDPVNEQWVKTRLKSAAALTLHDMLTVPPGGSASHIAIARLTSPAPGAIRFTPTVAGAAGGTSTAQNAPVRLDDTIGRRYYKVGSTWLLDLYVNGHKIYEGYDVTSKSVPITFKHGFQGNLATSGAAPGGVIDDFESGDPATRSMIWLDLPLRVANAKANGDVVLKLPGRYSGTAPAGLKYSLVNFATGAVVAGHDNVDVASFVAGAGEFAGYTATIASASVPATFYVKVTWTGLPSGGEAVDYSPVLSKGRVLLTYGQSLMQEMIFKTSGVTLTAPANAWVAQGSVDYNAVEYQRRTLPVVDNSPTALLLKTIQDAQGAEPMCVIGAFKGGAKISERLPGSTHFTALLEGIRRAGGDTDFMLITDGTFDVASADRSTYIANQNAIVDAVEAEIGHSIKVVLCTIGSIWNSPVADCEALRFLQWKLCQDNPSRYKLGPYTMDLQHASGDQFHLTDVGYAEQARRMGWAINQMDGVANSDRIGPKILSVAKNSSSQITVTFDLNGATGLEIANSGYASDFRGGLRFAAASSFASPLSPTGATINAVVGTQQSVTYTFAGTPFAGQAFVSGPYGSQPFNPENDTTIRADVANKASMLRGLFSGEPAIPVQPYYQASGVNYVAS